MGFGKIVEAPVSAVNSIATFAANPFGIFDPSTRPNFFQRDDFRAGFSITPIVDGKEVPNRQVKLIGNYMPMVPFVWGGTLRHRKDYYPGNPEPVTQVLGTQEDDLTIKCRWHGKSMPQELRETPTEMVKLVDSIRLSGDLVVLRLGDWKRYAFLTKAKFDMATMADISVELTFSIVGFFLPNQSQIIDESRRIPFAINTKLIADAAAFQEKYSTIPAYTPGSLITLLNDAIDEAATAIAAVTSFVDEVITAVEDASATYQRALGAARYAMGALVRFRRRLYFAVSSALVNTNDFLSMTEKYNITAHFQAAAAESRNLTTILEEIRARFADLAATLPQVRHRVQDGDTLQSISTRYFGVPEQWQKIFEHNKMSSTQLTPGTVLEIPRLA